MDQSYESMVIRNMIKNNSLKTIYCDFDWDLLISKDKAFFSIAQGLFDLKDYYNAKVVLEKANYWGYELSAVLYTKCLACLGCFDQSIMQIDQFLEKFKSEKFRVLGDQVGQLLAINKLLESGMVDLFELEKSIENLRQHIKFYPSLYFYIKAKACSKRMENDEAGKYYLKAVITNPVDVIYYKEAKKIFSENIKQFVIDQAKNRILDPFVFCGETSSKPLVSVIIPTYNRKDRLPFAIISVLNQTYQNFEILVINDCGDDIIEVIESLNDQRIKYFVQPENKGPAAARNVGLQHAAGDYIAYLDDDDVYYPNHLSTLCEATLKNTEINVFYTDAIERMMKLNGTERVTISEVVRYSIDFDQETLLTKNITPTLCVFHKKCIIGKSGVFDESLKTHEDWDLWLKFSKLGRFLHIKKTTCEYSRVEGGDSLTKNHLHKFYESLHLIYNRYPVFDEKIQVGRINEMQKLINLMQTTAASSKPVMVSDSAGAKSIKYCIELIKNNEFVKAQTELEGLLLNDPLNNNVLFLLCTAAIAQKNDELFLRTYSKLLQLEEQNNSKFVDFELYLKSIVPQKTMFRDSANAHKWLDGLSGIEIGAAAHNSFGLNSRNVALRIDSYGYSFLKDYGLVSKIDIEAEMSDIPLESESEDFILSSHAIEHSANFIKTVLEWYRICKVGGYIYVITPKKNACDSHRTLSDWQKIYNDYLNDTKAEKDYHYNVFTIELMKEFFYKIFGNRVELVDFLESDDKVGNGFTVVYRKKRSMNSSFPWILKNGNEEFDLVSEPKLLPTKIAKEQVLTQSNKCDTRIKIAVFPNDHRNDGCSHYRILSPFGVLLDDVQVLWVEDFLGKGASYAKRYAELADIIVIQRFFPNPDTQVFIDYLFSLNKPVVYEIDDLLTELPITNPSYGWSVARKPYIYDVIKKATVVTVSTARLKKHLEKLNPKVVVLPNLINDQLWNRPINNMPDKIVIGYAGTRTHAADLKIIEQALFMVAEKYRNRVAFIFMGCKTENLEKLPGFNYIAPEKDYCVYADNLQNLPIDLMLVPLQDSEFNRCKSNIKWLEFSACQITGIFSDLEPYNGWVNHHQTGLLVSNDTQSWYNAICEMVDNSVLRKQIAMNARVEVLQNHPVKSGAHLWLELYRALADQNFTPTHEPVKSVIDVQVVVTNVVSFSIGDIIPSSQYLRQIAPLMLLEKSSSFRVINGWQFVTKVQGKNYFDYSKLPSDTIIFLQRDFSNLEFVLESPLEVIYEIDDNLMGLPVDHPDYQNYLPLSKLLKKYLPKFDMIVTSTESLKVELLKYNSRVKAIPNFLPLMPSDLPSKNTGKCKILVSGTKSHLADMNFLIPAIRSIAQSYSESVEFVFWGFIPGELKNIANIHFMDTFVKDYRAYLSALAAINADIGLIPLADTKFNSYKSDIKWKEYSACKMATIASDVLSYKSIVNGYNGILVANQADIWQQEIEKLILNIQLRNKIAENAHQTIISEALLEHNIGLWENALLAATNPKKDTNPLVSIIIPVWNKVELTKQCLEALFNNTTYSNYEVIVVDNNSTDSTAEYLVSLVKRVKVATNPENLGFAKAINIGVQIANGDYLVFLNNDTIPLNGWLEALVESMEQNTDAGIVGAKLLYPDDSIQHCGVALRRDRAFFKHPYKFVERNHPLVNNFREWDAVTAACFITRTNLFKELGMLDESYLNGCEDIDYCCAVKAKGYKIFYQPQAELYHLESQTPRMEKKDESNFSRFVAKWGRYAIKTEMEIFIYDGFWAKDDNKYVHKYDERVKLWNENLNKAQKNNELNNVQRISKLIRHLYPVVEWNCDEPDLSNSLVNVSSHQSSMFEKLNNKQDVIYKKESKLNILFVCHDFPPHRFAGAQIYAKNLAQALNRTGKVNVEIFYPVVRTTTKDYSIVENEYEGLRVFELFKENSIEPGKVYNQKVEDAFFEFIKSRNYQLIHFHGLGQLSLAPLYVANSLGIKTVFTFHDYWILCDHWHLIRTNQEFCSGPESVEKCAKCYIKDGGFSDDIYPIGLKYHQVRREYFKKIFNLIDLKLAPSKFLVDKFNQFGFKGIQKSQLGFVYDPPVEPKKQNTKLVFAYIGQIIPRKGLLNLLEAFSLINSENIELKIWGKSNPGEYFNKISSLIQKDNRVEYMGAFTPSDLPNIYSETDIAVLPSLMENYPLGVFEAIQYNKPIITSNAGGIPEIIKHQQNGLLFQADSIIDLADKISYAIHNLTEIKGYLNYYQPLKTIDDDALDILDKYCIID